MTLLTATRGQLDLRDQAAVNYWFKANRPEYVYLVAGTVGGILANSTRPAEFIYDNMLIHATVVHAAHVYRVKKLLYLGSCCIYPRGCEQPMREKHLLTGIGPGLPDSIDGTDHIDVGTGENLSIRELADTVRDSVYPEAQLVFDTSKPDGTPRELLDVSRLDASDGVTRSRCAKESRRRMNGSSLSRGSCAERRRRSFRTP